MLACSIRVAAFFVQTAQEKHSAERDFLRAVAVQPEYVRHWKTEENDIGDNVGYREADEEIPLIDSTRGRYRFVPDSLDWSAL